MRPARSLLLASLATLLVSCAYDQQGDSARHAAPTINAIKGPSLKGVEDVIEFQDFGCCVFNVGITYTLPDYEFIWKAVVTFDVLDDVHGISRGVLVTDVGGAAIRDPGASKGDTVIPMANVDLFTVGAVVRVGSPTNSETAIVRDVYKGDKDGTNKRITVESPLRLVHTPGEPVVPDVRNVALAVDVPGDIVRKGEQYRYSITLLTGRGERSAPVFKTIRLQ